MLKFRWLAGVSWLALAAGMVSADEPLPPPTKLNEPAVKAEEAPSVTPPTSVNGPVAIDCYTERCVPRRMTCARLARAIEWLRRPRCEDSCRPRFCFNWWSREWKCAHRLWGWGTYRPLCDTFPGVCSQEECHPPLWTYFPPSKYNKPLAPVPCDDHGWDWPILSYLFRPRACDTCGPCRPGLFSRFGCRTCASGTCATPADCPTGCAVGCSACDGSRSRVVAGKAAKMPVLPPSVFRKCDMQPAVNDSTPPPVVEEQLPMPRK